MFSKRRNGSVGGLDGWFRKKKNHTRATVTPSVVKHTFLFYFRRRVQACPYSPCMSSDRSLSYWDGRTDGKPSISAAKVLLETRIISIYFRLCGTCRTDENYTFNNNNNIVLVKQFENIVRRPKFASSVSLVARKITLALPPSFGVHIQRLLFTCVRLTVRSNCWSVFNEWT